jgi:hypothetical protein
MDDGRRWKINCYNSAPCGGVHFRNGKNQDQENRSDNHTDNNRLGPVTHFSRQTEDSIRRSIAGSTKQLPQSKATGKQLKQSATSSAFDRRTKSDLLVGVE